MHESALSQHEIIGHLKNHKTKEEEWDRINCFILFTFKRKDEAKENRVNKTDDSDTALSTRNDQTILSPRRTTGVTLTNSCRLIFYWRHQTRQVTDLFWYRYHFRVNRLFNQRDQLNCWSSGWKRWHLSSFGRATSISFSIRPCKSVNNERLASNLLDKRRSLIISSEYLNITSFVCWTSFDCLFSLCSHTNWCFCEEKKKDQQQYSQE